MTTLAEAQKKLEALQTKHYKLVTNSKEDVQEAQRVVDKLLIEEDNEKILSGMSDEQKKALAQSIRANGTESSEVVGTPGAN